MNRCLHPKTTINGHSRSADVAALSMANGCAERMIGAIRRECVEHIVVLGERHLRHVLQSCMNYYNEVGAHCHWRRMRQASRSVQRAGRILCRPFLGGLHHQMSGFNLRQAHGFISECDDVCRRQYKIATNVEKPPNAVWRAARERLLLRL